MYYIYLYIYIYVYIYIYIIYVYYIYIFIFPNWIIGSYLILTHILYIHVHSCDYLHKVTKFRLK